MPRIAMVAAHPTVTDEELEGLPFQFFEVTSREQAHDRLDVLLDVYLRDITGRGLTDELP